MNSSPRTRPLRAFVIMCCLAATLPARAQDPSASNWFAAAPDSPPPPEWTKPVPLTFSIDYTLVSDYIFRGINFSEYPGEGREKPNHQMSVGVEWDTGDFGAVGFSAWFEWYADQPALTGNGHNQEIDYTVYWSYPIDALATTVETGWIAYVFPQTGGDGRTDYEWYLSLSFDDSKLFGTESAVLNPSVAYYHDLDLAPNTSWWEFGVSHPFALADCGLANTPVLKDITLAPSLTLGVQHRYFHGVGVANHPSTGLANLLYGLDLSYDLSRALHLPPQAGSLTVGGFLNFSQAFTSALNDELFGGLKVAYSW